MLLSVSGGFSLALIYLSKPIHQLCIDAFATIIARSINMLLEISEDHVGLLAAHASCVSWCTGCGVFSST